CYDIVLSINASPVPASSIIPYALSSNSTFQQGCFDPCDCALQQPVGLTGGFALVPLQPSSVPSEFAVINVNWSAPASAPNGAAHHLAGTGIYRQTPSLAGAAPMQRMSLNLTVDGGSLTHFDSGLVPLQSPPGKIDVVVSINGMFCFDTVLSVHAHAIAPLPLGLGRLAISQ